MLITRTSILSGIERTVDIPVTQGQLDIYQKRNVPAQTAFANLSKDHREFIMTGITEDEWASLLPEE